MSKWPEWTIEENDILLKCYSNEPISEICKKINRSKGSIQKRASNLGLTNFVKNQHLSQIIYERDFNFFDTPDICNSYWAGFIAADGSFGKDNSIKISISIKDIELLNNFVKHTCFSGKIKTFNIKDKEYCSICIWGAKRWRDSLILNWNIAINNKTELLEPPNNLTKENKLAFLIGLIDGDGWCYLDKKNYLHFGLCGTKSILDWANEIFNEIIEKKIKIQNNGKSKINFRIDFVCKQARRIREYLITNVDIPWRLERKWNVID